MNRNPPPDFSRLNEPIDSGSISGRQRHNQSWCVSLTKLFWDLALVQLCTACLVAQGQTNDTKQGFLKAIDGKLSFLSESWESREYEHREQRYWTVKVQPLKAGDYTVIHDCRNVPKLGGYERCKHSYPFTVAPSGTRRIHTADDMPVGTTKGTHPEALLGDSVSLVFELSPHYADHEWSVEFQPAAEQASAPAQLPADLPSSNSNVVNEADAVLHCTAIKKAGYVMRTGKTVPFMLVSFEAIAPTNMNFRISLLSTGASVRQASGPPVACSTRVANPSYSMSTQEVRLVVVPKDTVLDYFIGMVRESNYTPGRGASMGTWGHLGVGDSFVMRVGDSVQMKLMGEFNTASRIQCEAFP